MRISCVDVEIPVVVLPRASVGPHSIAPSTELDVLNATRNDDVLVSQTEGPRVRLCACNDGGKKRRMEPSGPMISPRWRMVDEKAELGVDRPLRPMATYPAGQVTTNSSFGWWNVTRTTSRNDRVAGC